MHPILRRGLKITAGVAATLAALRVVERVAQSAMGRSGTVTMAREQALSPDVATSARYVTVFGGTDLDLRAAVMDPDGARIEIVTVLGGTRVIVPEDWRVEVSGTSVLGGHEVAVPGGDGPVLQADLTTVLGGVLFTSDADHDVVLAVRIADDPA